MLDCLVNSVSHSIIRCFFALIKDKTHKLFRSPANYKEGTECRLMHGPMAVFISGDTEAVAGDFSHA